MLCSACAQESAGQPDVIRGLKISVTRAWAARGELKAMPTCVMQESLLLGLGAEKKLLSSGDLYLNRELQEWKLGEPNAHDLAAQVAFGSMQTVYDNGFYL